MLPESTATNFATELKKARNNQSLTLKELAKKAGISEVMPGRYENGKAVPTIQTWQKLNDALGFEKTKQPELDIKKIPTEKLIAELKVRGAVEIKF